MICHMDNCVTNYVILRGFRIFIFIKNQKHLKSMRKLDDQLD